MNNETSQPLLLTAEHFLTHLRAVNILQETLIEQLHHITHSLDETELPMIHQHFLQRGQLLAVLENQAENPCNLDTDTPELITLKALDEKLAQALISYQMGLQSRLNLVSKQRSGLTHYALAGHLPAEILYRDEA